LVSPHREYRRLGHTEVERQSEYRQLFRARIPDKTVEEIRSATNKAWVLGNDRFRERVAKQLDRRVAPAAKGGDRKSKVYKDKVVIDRV